MDNEIVLRDKDLAYAQTVCASITDVNRRNMAVANVIAARSAAAFFEEKYNVDCETGLHNIPNVVNDIDVSDIYVNGSYVDVRVYFSSDELCIPKSHFDYGIEPEVYMFIRLSQDLSGGVVTGFIKSVNIDKSNLNDGYYYITENMLCGINDVEELFVSKKEGDSFSRRLIYQYIDGLLGEEDKINFIKSLLASEQARKLFIKTVKAQSVYKMISINESLQTSVDNDLSEDVNDNVEDDLSDVSVSVDSLLEDLQYTTEVTPSSSELIEELDKNNSKEEIQSNDEGSEQIDTLFDGEQEGVPVPKKKKSNNLLMFLLLILVCSGVYWWYTNIYSQNANGNLEQAAPLLEDNVDINNMSEQQKAEAMPNETVDKAQDISTNKEEGNSIAIPAIEHNLDASVLVSNLKVDWEVPAGYASNTAAKRYLIKLGKVIQLDLKAELLLLTKPPIANKITVELQFDNDTGKFSLVGIKDSSGEKTVDDVIIRTVKNALGSSTISNNEAFVKLQGNPILIIHL